VEYRPIYVVVGIVAVAVISIIASILDPTGEKALPVAIGSALVLLVGMVAYQWLWVSSRSKVRAPEALTPAARSDPGLITDYWAMYRLLAIEPLDDETVRKAQKSTSGLMKSGMKMVVLVCLLPLIAGVVAFTGWTPDFGSGAWLVILPVVLGPVALLWVRYMLGRAAESAGSWLEPLGMQLVSLPEVSVEHTASGSDPRVRGASVMAGRRHGRDVHVSLGAEHVTRVAADVPPFAVTVDGDRPRAGADAPSEIAAALEPLGSSGVWKKLRGIEGGSDGIVARRGVDAENGWMWDLWLCERLAEELTQPAPAR
jgi:hypothetical protein